MTVKLKRIVREETVEVYVATDGKEFEDKSECMDHEHDMLMRQICATGWDLERTFDMDKAYLVRFANPEECKRFVELSEWYGLVSDGLPADGTAGDFMFIEYGTLSRWGTYGDITAALDKCEGGSDQDEKMV